MNNFEITDKDLNTIKQLCEKYKVGMDEFAKKIIRLTSTRRESNRIQIRLNEYEQNIIKSHADDLGLGVSTYCRMVALNADTNIQIEKYSDEIELSRTDGIGSRKVNESHVEKLNIRFKSNSEIDAIEDKAVSLGLDISEYIRFAAVNSKVTIKNKI